MVPPPRHGPGGRCLRTCDAGGALLHPRRNRVRVRPLPLGHRKRGLRPAQQVMVRGSQRGRAHRRRHARHQAGGRFLRGLVSNRGGGQRCDAADQPGCAEIQARARGRLRRPHLAARLADGAARGRLGDGVGQLRRRRRAACLLPCGCATPAAAAQLGDGRAALPGRNPHRQRARRIGAARGHRDVCWPHLLSRPGRCVQAGDGGRGAGVAAQPGGPLYRCGL